MWKLIQPWFMNNHSPHPQRCAAVSIVFSRWPFSPFIPPNHFSWKIPSVVRSAAVFFGLLPPFPPFRPIMDELLMSHSPELGSSLRVRRKQYQHVSFHIILVGVVALRCACAMLDAFLSPPGLPKCFISYSYCGCFLLFQDGQCLMLQKIPINFFWSVDW